MVMVWGWAFLSDYFQTRWLIVMAQAVCASSRRPTPKDVETDKQVIGFIPSIILAIWNVPLGAKYFACTSVLFLRSALLLTWIGFATFLSLATAPPIFAWMSDLSPHDAEQRAFILGFSIACYYAVGTYWLCNQPRE